MSNGIEDWMPPLPPEATVVTIRVVVERMREALKKARAEAHADIDRHFDQQSAELEKQIEALAEDMGRTATLQ